MKITFLYCNLIIRYYHVVAGTVTDETVTGLVTCGAGEVGYLHESE